MHSPVGTLQAGKQQGDDIIVPDYVDNEEWSWASRRRQCGVKEGSDAIDKDGSGSGAPEGFVGWPVTDVNALNDAGETALHRAAGCRGEAAPAGPGYSAGGGGGLAVMRHLLTLGADPNARDARGLTPLMTILVKGKDHLGGARLWVISRFFHGMNIYIFDGLLVVCGLSYTVSSPRWYKDGHIEVFPQQFELSKPSTLIGCWMPQGMERISLLLNAKADPNARDNLGETVLHKVSDAVRESIFIYRCRPHHTS